jgi:ABC-type multidrug transport system ATPase subunit
MNGFAEQQDVHADYCTVGEAIDFSAKLRLPATVTATTRKAFVDEVLALLELQPLEARRTGSLSQGEKKRLTIGVELAANPSILFLDEPTTGLDARSAAVVMRVIRNIANTGRTVVATIHQPSADVFFGFDELLCLIPGGYQTFNGPLHGAHKHAEKLVKYLEAIPCVEALPHGVNPATWMLEQMAAVSAHAKASAADSAKVDSTPEAELKIRTVDAEAGKASVSDLSVYYTASALGRATAAVIEDCYTNNKAGLPVLAKTPGFLTQFATLFTRMMRFMWRNTLWNGLRLFVFIFLSLFFGLLYLNIDDSDQAGVFGKIAVALNSILFISIINLNTGIPSYATLRGVYYREKAAGFYSPVVYPLTLIMCELPWTAFFGLVYLAINYFLVGFTPSAGDFFTAYISCVLCPWWFAIMGMGFIGAFPVPLLANIAGGLTIQICILFAGVQLSVNELPAAWRFMYYADGFAHALRLFMLPQYDNDSKPIVVVVNGRPTLISRADFLEQRMGTTPDKAWDALGWLILIVAGAAVLCSIFYVKINHQKR